MPKWEYNAAKIKECCLAENKSALIISPSICHYLVREKVRGGHLNEPGKVSRRKRMSEVEEECGHSLWGFDTPSEPISLHNDGFWLALYMEKLHNPRMQLFHPCLASIFAHGNRGNDTSGEILRNSKTHYIRKTPGKHHKIFYFPQVVWRGHSAKTPK